MVTVERRWLIWRDRIAFFALDDELQRLCLGLSRNTILRVRQTPARLENHPNLVRSEMTMTNFIDLTKDLDTIYKEMDPKSCRYIIRRAERLKDNIHIALNTPEGRRDFLNVYNAFVRLKRHTYPLTASYLDKHLPVSDVWVAYFEGRPMSAHLFVRDMNTKRAHFCYGASERLNNKEDARISGDLNRYLHWQEIQAYKAKGFELYDFGGGGFGSLKDFKLSFGGFQMPEYSYLLAGLLGAAPYQIYNRLLKLRLQLQI